MTRLAARLLDCLGMGLACVAAIFLLAALGCGHCAGKIRPVAQRRRPLGAGSEPWEVRRG